LGFFIAFLLYLDKKGTRLLRPILLIPMLIPPVVVGLCWRILFTPDLGGINYFLRLIHIRGPDWLGQPGSALVAVTIASVWEWTPFVMLVLLAGLESLPRDPVESAIIDGASWFQMLYYIIIPLLKPVLLVVIILRIIESLGILPVVFVMTGGGPVSATEAINLYAYNAGLNYLDIAYASSLLVVFIFIIFIFSLAFIKSAIKENV
jgi:ABC-type sugar transport system permease subunit